MVLAESLCSDSRPASMARFPVPVVDPEPAGRVAFKAGDALSATQVLTQQVRGKRKACLELVIRYIGQPHRRRQAAQEQHFRFVDIADAARNALVEQNVSKQGVGIEYFSRAGHDSSRRNGVGNEIRAEVSSGA